MNSPKIVFDDEPQRPWLRWVLIAGGALLLVAALVGVYRWAWSAAGGEWRKARAAQTALSEQRASLAEQVEALEQQNQGLRAQLAYLEQSGSIDSMACETLRSTLQDMEAELASAREQIAFYRGIVSPQDAKAGIRIQSMRLTPLEPDRVFAYKLVLIQAMRHDRVVKGSVSILVEGLLNGNVTELPWSTLEIGAEERRGRATPFAFKYFEELVGQIALPAEFVPTRLTVTLNPSTRGLKPVTRRLEWAELIRG